MNDGQDKGRFAELAMELMGSKMVADVVREIWQSASPEVKRELADKVMAKIGEQLAQESLYAEGREVVREAVKKSVEVHLPVVRERVEAEAKKILAGDSVETEVRRLCNEFVRTAAKIACREAATQIR